MGSWWDGEVWGNGLGYWKEVWGLGSSARVRVGVGEMPEGGGGEEAESPCWVRNVAAGGPLSRLATPGQVSPPAQNKGAARRASVLASGDSPSPELRLREPTPRRSETLQPTSPGVSARGAGYRRTNGFYRIPRPEVPASSSSSRPAGRPPVQG